MKSEKRMDLDWSSAVVVDLTDEINQVPCVIKLNGPAPVSHYFKPKLTSNLTHNFFNRFSFLISEYLYYYSG